MDATGPTNFRKDYRLLREGGRLIMYGLSEASDRDRARHGGGCAAACARMPMATMPWWKSLPLMNENKGVFGLNMLALAGPGGTGPGRSRRSARSSRAGSIDPVVAEAFPFDRAGDAHRFIGERRNIGKVVLVP